MKIALLEDEIEQARHLSDKLVEHRHACEFFHTGQSFIYAVTHNSYDLLIMDWQLPDMEGPEVLREIRAQMKWRIPVLFLTQRESEEDVVAALQAGADDYVVKPPRTGELMARLEALSRRLGQDSAPQEKIERGPFVFDLQQRSATFNGEDVTLTDKDFDLAVFLFQNAGRLLSREYLLERVWGLSSEINTRTVDTHMSRLRRKLGIKPENGYRIKTIYQHGYRLEELSD